MWAILQSRIILQPMCGRSTLHDAPTNILERFSLPPVLPGFEPHFNIAPTQLQWTILRDGASSAEVRQLKWGLVPSWANDPSIGNRMVNARAESLTERPSFRETLETRRCVILADGYYEWKVVGKSKVPMYFRLSDGRAFGLAGLWDRWERGDTMLETCTVITTDASPLAATVHDRMPALLVDEATTSWLDPSAKLGDLRSFLSPYSRNDLEMYEVGRYVNNAANDSPACIERVVTQTAERAAENAELFLWDQLAPLRPRSPG
jgi:putative SOS response-associated peptidase YedK